MFLEQIYDPALSQYAYLIGCQRTEEAIIIDPQRDIDRYQNIAAKNDLTIVALAETHIHADFVSGAREFVETVDGLQAYLSDEGDADWKYVWAKGNEKVTFVKGGHVFKIGNIQFTVIHCPGHTPEHISFLIEDQGAGANEPMALVSGDFMFVGDVGRPDLLETAAGTVGAREPSARRLYSSILEFSKLPEYLQVLPGHGAGSSCGKALGSIPFSTAGYEKRFNTAVTTALHQGEDAFVDDILSGQPEPPAYFVRMKRVNRDGIAVLGSLPTPQKMTPDELAQLAALNSPDTVFLDVRTNRTEFMAKHLKGSLHTPYQEKFSVAAGSYLAADQEIYLLLQDENQIDTCVRELIRMGFDHIKGYALLPEALSAVACEVHFVETRSITTKEMDKVHAETPHSTILDVRSTGEYEESHLQDALHIAYTRVAVQHSELPSPEQGPLIVHCGSGLRASLAIPYLERLGYETIYADGMFTDWLAMQPAGKTC